MSDDKDNMREPEEIWALRNGDLFWFGLSIGCLCVMVALLAFGKSIFALGFGFAMAFCMGQVSKFYKSYDFSVVHAQMQNEMAKDWVEDIQSEAGLEGKKRRLSKLTTWSQIGLVALAGFVVAFVTAHLKAYQTLYWVSLVGILLSYLTSWVLIVFGARPFGPNSKIVGRRGVPGQFPIGGDHD